MRSLRSLRADLVLGRSNQPPRRDLINDGPLSPLTGDAALDELLIDYSKGDCPTASGVIVPVASFRNPKVASGESAHSADHFTSVLRAAHFAAHIDRWDEHDGVYAEGLHGTAHQAVDAQLCEAMLSVVEERDSNTGAHERLVGSFAQAIARELGLSAVEVKLIVRAAELHDIGKIATPDTILRKLGRLTDEERAVMQEHSRAIVNCCG